MRASARPNPRCGRWPIFPAIAQRQEDVFQELQHAIEYLDHAPCGFFSVNPKGELVYRQRHTGELARSRSCRDRLRRSGSSTDIVSGDGASLLTSIVPMPGEVKTEVFDIDLRMRNGKTMPVRLYHKLAFGADGVPGASRTLVISRARDERSDPQRAAEVRFMRFFDHTPMAIATVDRDGTVVRGNARFAKLAQSLNTSGAVNKSILGRRQRPRPQPARRGHRPRRPGQGDIPPVEALLEGAKERWGQFFVTAVEENERETEAAIVYMLETTERRTLENQVNQAQKMDTIGQLAGGIAHDFNNVLSAIMMANDFLLNAHKPTDPSFQDIMQIKQNATRAATLVRQLLAFSRRQTLRPTVLNLGDALSDIDLLLKRLIGEKVKLEVVHGRDLWPVKVDISQFEQVIVNLAVNARDAMPDGGALTVRTVNVSAEEAGRLSYKGMPPSDYVRDRCQRYRHRHSRRYRREDLRAVLLHQGCRQGHRPRPLHGLRHRQADRRFRLCRLRAGQRHHVPHLPAAPSSGKGSRSRSGDRGRRRRQGSRCRRKPRADLTGQGTILLVEDEEGLRALNARGLRSRGYTVVEAGNGVEAMELFDEQNGAIDLVVSDVVMPEMDGPTLLKEMRARNADIRIIFVSGYAEEAFEKSLPENQQFAFLAKPFALERADRQGQGNHGAELTERRRQYHPAF